MKVVSGKNEMRKMMMKRGNDGYRPKVIGYIEYSSY